MRNIKFRAWLKEPKIMAEVKSLDEFETKIPYGKGKCRKEKVVAVRQYEEAGALWWCYERDDGEETECELMQFTGLKDRKGREIFDGDIVEFVVDEPLAENREKRIIVGSVDFDRGSFWINTKKRFYDGTNYTDETLLSNFAYCCEVVGSIYKNSELFK